MSKKDKNDPVIVVDTLFTATDNIAKRIDELSKKIDAVGEERRLHKAEYEARKKEWEKEEKNFTAVLGQYSSNILILTEERRKEKEKLDIANKRVKELRALGGI